MKDFDIVHFYSPEELLEKSAGIFESEKRTLQGLFPGADIQQVGSCAIPGAWGKFDVDVNVRVAAEDFEETVRRLRGAAIAKHEHLWSDELAIFLKANSDVDIDYVVTVAGSPKDDFCATRDFLASRPDIVAEYNELKKSFEGKPYHEYRASKVAFFGGNGNSRFLKP